MAYPKCLAKRYKKRKNKAETIHKYGASGSKVSCKQQQQQQQLHWGFMTHTHRCTKFHSMLLQPSMARVAALKLSDCLIARLSYFLREALHWLHTINFSLSLFLSHAVLPKIFKVVSTSAVVASTTYSTTVEKSIKWKNALAFTRAISALISPIKLNAFRH